MAQAFRPKKKTPRHLNLTRRELLCLSAATGALALTGLNPGSASAASDPVVRYMNKVATRLQKAARQASPPAFLQVIRKHADTPSIATYSLGRYRSGLKRSRRRTYYNGVARLIAHYFAEQTKQYRVEKFEMGDRTWQEGKYYFIDSTVTLTSGSRYTVRWKIIKSGRRHKIADVRVLGRWLTRLLRKDFEDFVSSRGDNVSALLAALKRF